MSLKYGLLGFLSECEMSGYDLEKLFRNSIGRFWNAKISQVYRELHTMEKAGWLLSTEVVQADRPNKKLFRITDAGHEALESWLIHYDIRHDFEVRIGILMRVFFAAKRPKEETIALLERFRTACHHATSTLNSVDKELECYDMKSMELLCAESTLSFGKKYYNMQAEWCTETIERLQSMDKEMECNT